ncbi:MAG: DUF2809 domain-containing protein [Myxococcaceae bacterium]
MRLRTRRQWAVFATALFVLEVLIATVWRHVPVLRTDLGDYFVTVLVYAFVKAVLPARWTLARRCSPSRSSCSASASRARRRWGWPIASASPPAAPARIVLGATFDWGDAVAMYGAGCLTAWLLDGARVTSSSTSSPAARASP